MNIELPAKFYYEKEQTKAYVENDTLYIEKNVSFERLMYHTTYELKGDKTCSYCGCELNDENRTLDHVYPRDFGGVSITNNLLPCCTVCNQKKNNMMLDEYYKYLSIKDSKARKKFKNETIKKHEEYRYKEGFFLPKDWVTYTSERIFVDILLKEECAYSKRYKFIGEFYDKHNKFPRPIVISNNNILLDGFLVLLFAKYNNISVIPCIKLDNVIQL